MELFRSIKGKITLIALKNLHLLPVRYPPANGQVERRTRSMNYLIILSSQAARFQRVDATSALTGAKYEKECAHRAPLISL